MSTVGSLLDSFSAPQGFEGSFGWVCGFSADADFVNKACERFAGLSESQRSASGRIWLGVMVDPCCPQIAPSATPGALHLLARSSLPYRLLHGKVALLSFRSEAGGDEWCVRLIVSTGNWTRMTIEESLDLAWSVDIESSNLGVAGTLQAAADVQAAESFLSYVRQHFATEALQDAPGPVAEENRDSIARLEKTLIDMRRSLKSKLPSRFIDNRTASFADQLPARVSENASDKRRNTIYLGSGFFETGRKNGRLLVIDEVLRRLRDKRLLTDSAKITLVVNPAACQQVATAGKALSDWTVLGASDPAPASGPVRTLHAKFIFSANLTSGADRYSSAWVYLGSGNLTGPGFLRRAMPGTSSTKSKGNLEAGVVFRVSDITPKQLGCLLPIDINGPNLAGGDHQDVLGPGDNGPERASDTYASPFAFVRWVDDEGEGCLCPPDGTDSSTAAIEDTDGNDCLRDARGRFSWPAEVAPIEVVVRWTTGGSSARVRVPVLDNFGRFASRPLTPLDCPGMVDELAQFPRTPEVGRGGGREVKGKVKNPVPPLQKFAEDPTPIRTMSLLIETIADRQTSLTEPLWKGWCSRLEQVLIRGKAATTVVSIRELGINPISVLFRPEFRPIFAESADSESGALYERVLNRIQEAWGVAMLCPLAHAGEGK